ncbi:MAG: aminopeptidase P family protein [Candidatus Cloacimonadota bacterium]|nr:MAG: aminopeptidase P family protein [Candidatus Cloacimonadota bacterium]
MAKEDAAVKNREIFEHLQKGSNYFLITNLKNIQFITGFSGDWAVLLLSKNRTHLLTDSRFTEQAGKETTKCNIITIKKPFTSYLKTLIKKRKKIAFESAHLHYELYRKIKRSLSGRSFIPVSGIIERLRMFKTSAEIQKISKAAKIADLAFSKILGFIKVGVREIEIASELEYILRSNGSTAHPFPTIALTSTNSSLPHGQPGMRKIKMGDLFLLDFGATYKGYVSDITRTVVVGKTTKKQEKIYNIVLKAQMAAIKCIKPDMQLKELDKTARDIIIEAGYGENFGHGLGHGIGLEVHESPGVSFRSKDIVGNGMVFTIEPAIYIPEWGGVRIEDDIAILNNRVKILTKSPKEKLIEV